MAIKLPLPSTNPSYQDYHTAQSVDLSHLSLDERQAIHGTIEDTTTVYESSKYTKRGFIGGGYFQCPVTGECLPKSQGVPLRGIYYSREAALDIMADGGRYLYDDGSSFSRVEAFIEAR